MPAAALVLQYWKTARSQWHGARSRVRLRFGERVILAAFCLSSIAISGVGFLAYYLLARSHESESWVLHTTVAISRLEALHKTLVETESAGRAFLVTGAPAFRESFRRTLDAIDHELHAFKEFTTDNQVQQQLAAELSQHIGRRFAYLEGQVNLRASGGFEALQFAKIGAGTAEMQLISAIVAQMKEVENRLLAERTIVRKRNNHYLHSALALLIVGGVTVMAVVFLYIGRLSRKRQDAEEQALELAHHDALTGLANRRLLADRLQIAIGYASRSDQLLAILCLDLDGFKLVNDAYGHDAGDALLQLVATRLQGIVRAIDTVARTGGDEFVVVLTGLMELTDGADVASKIIDRISAPYVVAGHQVTIGTSIGIAFYPMHGTTQSDLLKCADQALYEAKRLGRMRYEVAK